LPRPPVPRTPNPKRTHTGALTAMFNRISNAPSPNASRAYPLLTPSRPRTPANTAQNSKNTRTKRSKTASNWSKTVNQDLEMVKNGLKNVKNGQQPQHFGPLFPRFRQYLVCAVSTSHYQWYPAQVSCRGRPGKQP